MSLRPKFTLSITNNILCSFPKTLAKPEYYHCLILGNLMNNYVLYLTVFICINLIASEVGHLFHKLIRCLHFFTFEKLLVNLDFGSS